MVKEGEYVAIYNNIHRVLKAEKELKTLGLNILLIPAPRALSSDCGLAIRFSPSDRESVENAFAKNDLWPAELYIKKEESYERVP